jgi:hypothetical protein
VIRVIKISLKEVDRCKKLDRIVWKDLLNATIKRWREEILKRICALFVIKYWYVRRPQTPFFKSG